MNSEQLNRVSVIDPVTPAIDRVKLILFRPFDLGKWFVIGFCAWLAYLGTGGGGGGGFRQREILIGVCRIDSCPETQRTVWRKGMVNTDNAS